VAGWLAELHEVGLVELVEAARGRTPSTWQLAVPANRVEAGNLPEVEDVFPKLTSTQGRKAQTVVP
jgi:hypothetical protein